MTDRISEYYKRATPAPIMTDVSMMTESDQQIVDIAFNKEWTNPKFKMQWFVGQAQVTIYGKFRQWLQELKSKEEAIEDLDYNMAKYDVEIARQQRIKELSPDELDVKYAEVELVKLNRDKTRSLRIIQNWYLERQHYLDLINEFLASDEGKLKDGTGRTYMDIINTDEEDQYERLLWTNRLAKQASCDILFYGKINAGNMDAILSLAPEHQTEVFALATNFSMQVQSHLIQLQDISVETAKLGKAYNNNELIPPSAAALAEERKLVLGSLPQTPQQGTLNVYNI